jgi:hypothetical protein
VALRRITFFRRSRSNAADALSRSSSPSRRTLYRHENWLALKNLVLTLRRIDMAAAEGGFSDAATEYKNYRSLMAAAVPALLASAEPWSLFNLAVHDAHCAALRQVLQTKHAPY